MSNKTIEALLLRHYGQHAPIPAALEERLVSSLHRTMESQQLREQAINGSSAYHMNRRHAVRLVALASTGVGLLGASLELLDTALVGQDASQSAVF
jgi:hypothetical protein